MVANAAKHQAAQLKITLRHIKPAIWRRVLVPHDIKLDRLHDVIQAAMGWHDCHLHSFHTGGVYYQTKLKDEFFSGGDYDDDSEDETKYRLCDLLPEKDGKLLYTYDFGDSWEHDIRIEKLHPSDKHIPRAMLLAGENACPPEDCGGIPGYYNLIEALANPKHPEHAELRDWLGLEKGETFDPARFNIAAINARVEHVKI